METQDIGSQYVGMDSSMLMEMAHSKNTTHNQKVAAVSDQFESVLVKQFLKEALKPMFKGVFNEDGGAHRMYRHFFTDAISESIASGGGFGVSTILQQQLQSDDDESSLDMVEENK
jgi:Rod binding domain-containing protein|tara:strand:+ start:397 stop:744 length:348 start_codon:yes stop_codon:yes gene_type:complete